jgi:hypothetical protein
MKRWMVGAVTVLAAVGGLSAPGVARASSGAWNQTYQVNTSGMFTDIAAISNSNIWAVGVLSGRKGRTIYQPFIRHYSGRRWKTVTIPGAPKFQSDQVSASAANNVWVFGLARGDVASTVAYRYDGSRWHKIQVPAETDLASAVTLGPKNVWAVGSSATIFAPGADSSATIFHWNGSRWRGYNLANGNLVAESISASATNDVWIAGGVWRGSVELAEAYRWNGKAWHKADLPRVRTGVPSVTAFSPANVWVGWDTATAAHVVHWDGRRWRALTIPADILADTGNVVPDGEGGYWFGDAAILTGDTWTSVPAIYATGGFGGVVRIPGTESFLQAAGVVNPGSTTESPTLYRFDL